MHEGRATHIIRGPLVQDVAQWPQLGKRQVILHQHDTSAPAGKMQATSKSQGSRSARPDLDCSLVGLDARGVVLVLRERRTRPLRRLLLVVQWDRQEKWQMRMRK